MSRSYNEDWERKKSYLIRSLFHDIQFRTLSPVPECPENSDEDLIQSSDTQLPQESTSSPEIYSQSASTTSETLLAPVPPPSEAYTSLSTRPYSPLPPLIIERMPNRHDDPPEYYEMLFKKMRKIYRKMFIEGKNLSDDDFDSDYQKQSIMEGIFEIASNLSDGTDASEARSSFCSGGYSADIETSDCEDSDNCESNLASIEFTNVREGSGSFNNAPIANGHSNSVEESVNINTCTNNNDTIVEMRKASVSIEEAEYRQITIQADVHIDGAERVVRPSPVYEESTTQATVAFPDTIPLTKSPEELSCETMYLGDKEVFVQDAQVLEDPHKCGGLEKVAAILNREELLLVSTQGSVCEEPLFDIQQYHETDEPIVPVSTTEVLVPSPILPTHVTRAPVMMMRRDDRPSQENYEESEYQDANYRQTTSQTDDHDGSSTEAQVNKDSPKPAFVLRFSNIVDNSFVAERELPRIGHVEEATPTTEESENVTNNHIEVMRTPQHEASVDSIPIDVTRYTSDMELTCGRNDNSGQRDISTLTSASQDGCHISNLAEPKSSCDIDNILTSIFNESLQESVEGINEGSSDRKRRYKDISIQTENVRWEDLRTNFFVGTPKIFRLCSCVDHFCN